jgi:tetratricopeptide (TPR) repeat protein
MRLDIGAEGTVASRDSTGLTLRKATVGIPSDPRPAATTGEVLVGREAELAILEGLLAAAVAGDGSVVFVTGEPGIGKTAVTSEFLRRARRNPDVAFCQGRCVDHYGSGEAYLPFLDALGTLAAGSDRERAIALMRAYAPTWCLHVPAAAESPGVLDVLRSQTVGATKERMLRELVDLLGAAADAFPVIILLEDIQWADPSSIDALRFLGSRVARQRVLLIGTFRPADLEVTNQGLRSCRLDLLTAAHGHEIALTPLDQAGVGAFLAGRFPGHRFPEHLAAFVHERTEGHPLFVVEFVDLLVAQGHLALREGAWTEGRPFSDEEQKVPENLREMIRRKVELLPEADRAALQSASVIGQQFLSTVLATVLDADELALEERLLRLDRAHRLVDTRGEEELPDGSLATCYRFTHGLYREVIYEDLVSKRRTALHQKVGQALLRHYRDQKARISGALALHFERGRDFANAVNALGQAGDKAAGLWAYGEALEHYSRALGLVDRLPAEEQAARRLQVHEKRGPVLYAMGRFDDAARDYTLMLEEARQASDPAREYAALSGLCDAHFFELRLEEMAVRAHEALEAAGRAGSERLQVQALVHVAQVVEAEGRLGESLPLFDEIIASSRRLGHEPSLLSALAYRGLARYWQSEYALAEEAFTEATELALRRRHGFLALACRMHLGSARGRLGRLAETRALFDETIEMARRNGDRIWLPRLVCHLGWIHRELQDFPRAQEYDEEGLRLARERHIAAAPETEALLGLCVDYARAGRADDALEMIEALERVRTRSRGAWFGWLHEIRMESAVTEHWLIRGEFDRTTHHARRLQQVAAEVGAKSQVAAALRFQAEAALGAKDPVAARTLAETAVARLQDCEAPLEAWKAQATLGRACERASAREAARAAWRAAEGIVRGLAAGLTDESLRDVFLASEEVQRIFAGAQPPND